ncbi:MAG: hypothetical protein WCF88_09445 [Candidatus Acidiferrales bacterium]|jgi:hypothetical protein
MVKAGRQAQRMLAFIFMVYLTLTVPADAADLQPQTAKAYDRYIELTGAQVTAELAQRGAYLWVERLPAVQRAADEEQLRNGQLVIERLETLDSGKPISTPEGIIHHWIGTVFVPGATLAQTLSFLQDYDHKVEYFKPDIVRSKILRHEGDDYFVLLRFYKKKIITTVIDTDQEVHYHTLDSTHAYSRSRTTRVQEVENAGKSDETLEPEGHDRGFMWRMNTYWRFVEKDGGTYVECQAISLTRDIPTGLGWMVGSFVTSVPRESLTFTLTTARAALLQRTSKPLAN